MNIKKACFTIILLAILPLIISAQKIAIDKNKPERKEWFHSLGFGMFIHWSVDVQVGTIISHNVAASSKQYQDRYFNELPKYFNPKSFDPEEWAKLAKLSSLTPFAVSGQIKIGIIRWYLNWKMLNIMSL